MDQTNKPPTTKEGGSVPIDITNIKVKSEESTYDTIAITYDTQIATSAKNAWRPPEMDHLPQELIVPALPPLPWIKTKSIAPLGKIGIYVGNIHNLIPPSLDIDVHMGLEVCPCTLNYH